MEPARFGVQNEKLAGGRKCHDECPSLINLLNRIQLSIFNWMKSDELELHVSKQIERISFLVSNPIMKTLCRCPHDLHQLFNVRR